MIQPRNSDRVPAGNKPMVSSQTNHDDWRVWRLALVRRERRREPVTGHAVTHAHDIWLDSSFTRVRTRSDYRVSRSQEVPGTNGIRRSPPISGRCRPRVLSSLTSSLASNAYTPRRRVSGLLGPPLWAVVFGIGLDKPWSLPVPRHLFVSIISVHDTGMEPYPWTRMRRSH